MRWFRLIEKPRSQHRLQGQSALELLVQGLQLRGERGRIQHLAGRQVRALDRVHHPDGTTRRITGGIQRVRYRHGPGTDAPVEPGTPVPVTIQLRATSIAFEAGDRIRLQVLSSGFPSFAIHPNQLEPARSEADLRVATTRVLHSGEHPSRLRLPIAPRASDAPPIRFEDP